MRIVFFFFQAEDGIRDIGVTGVQTCALPIWAARVERHGQPVGEAGQPGRVIAVPQPLGLTVAQRDISGVPEHRGDSNARDDLRRSGPPRYRRPSLDRLSTTSATLSWVMMSSNRLRGSSA